MYPQEFSKRLKIGIALVAGYWLGRLAADWRPEHYSALFSAAFLLGVIATQGIFKWLERIGRGKAR